MRKNLEKNIIFILTRDEILACAGEVGISKKQVTDNVIELVKSRLTWNFGIDRR